MDIDLAKKKLKSYLNWEEIHGFSKGPNDLAIETILNELEKKDKIIEEILKVWKQDDIRSVEELKECFTNKAEEDK